jgi:hypothetical protein
MKPSLAMRAVDEKPETGNMIVTINRVVFDTTRKRPADERSKYANRAPATLSTPI